MLIYFSTFHLIILLYFPCYCFIKTTLGIVEWLQYMKYNKIVKSVTHNVRNPVKCLKMFCIIFKNRYFS